MGKGDRKTAKGKRFNSSYGNARTQVTKKAAGATSAPVAKKGTAKSVTKTTSKTTTKAASKTAVKKTAKKVAKKKVDKE
jgi:30S ribosomal protein S31